MSTASCGGRAVWALDVTETGTAPFNNEALPSPHFFCARQPACSVGRHHVAVDDQSVDRVPNYCAGVLDSVVVIVARSIRSTPRWGVAIVDIVGRDDPSSGVNWAPTACR
jgi:hypothetical protein